MMIDQDDDQVGRRRAPPSKLVCDCCGFSTDEQSWPAGTDGLHETKQLVSTTARRELLPMNSWVCGRMQNTAEMCIATDFVATVSRSGRSTAMMSSLVESCLPGHRTPKPWLSQTQTCLHLIFSSHLHFLEASEDSHLLLLPPRSVLAFDSGDCSLTPYPSCCVPNAAVLQWQTGKHALKPRLVSSMHDSCLPVKLEKQIETGKPPRSSCHSAITSCKGPKVGRASKQYHCCDLY
jgi:hypothetical protein